MLRLSSTCSSAAIEGDHACAHKLAKALHEVRTRAIERLSRDKERRLINTAQRLASARGLLIKTLFQKRIDTLDHETGSVMTGGCQRERFY
jgi:hypothetical protein